MGSNDGYPWTRRDTESNPAYEAFRTYLQIRSNAKTAQALGKSKTLIDKWSSEHGWVERVKAYDVYLAEAETDAATDWISNARSETQALADKLRGLLSSRLDDCIKAKQDPTVRWSQAAGVLLKMQEAGIAPVENQKMAAELDRVSKLLEKVTGEPVGQ